MDRTMTGRVVRLLSSCAFVLSILSGCSLRVALPPPSSLPTELEPLPAQTAEVGAGVAAGVSTTTGQFGENATGGLLEARAGYGLTDRWDLAVMGDNFTRHPGGSVQLGYQFVRRPGLKVGTVFGLGSNFVSGIDQSQSCDEMGENCTTSTYDFRYLSFSPYVGVRTAWEFSPGIALGALVRGGYNFVVTLEGGGTPLDYPSIQSMVGLIFSPVPAMRLGIGVGVTYPFIPPLSEPGIEVSTALSYRFPTGRTHR